VDGLDHRHTSNVFEATLMRIIVPRMTFKLKAIFAFLQPEAAVCGAIAVILTFLASVELSVDEKKTR